MLFTLLGAVFVLLVSDTTGIYNPKFRQHKQMKSYIGYKLVKSDLVQTDSQVQTLLMDIDGVEGLNTWTRPKINASLYVVVSPSRLDYIKSLFSDIELPYQIVFDDLDKLIQEENPNAYNESTPCRKRKMNWIAYHRYKVILNYMKTVGRNNLRISYEEIGKSTEGREIGMVRIGNGKRPGVLIIGGLHAREWISPAVSTYIIDRLINDWRRKELALNFDWYFIPLVNVDGYEYTHTDDRYWRKSRSKLNGTDCYGVDLNRNWGFHWGEGNESSSFDPCSDYYQGQRQFSEPELVSLSKMLLSLKNKFKIAFNLHSFSQIWLLPWGYTAKRPSDYSELLRIAQIGRSALENTYGTKYTLGQSAEILYAATGSSDDWLKGVAGVLYSYTLEMRDNGTKYGFNLPAEQIKATGEETLNGIAAAVNAMI